MNVRLSKDQKVKILNSVDVYAVMQQILMRENKIGRNQEHLWVIGLDNKNKILFIELNGLGKANTVSASPRDIFRMAIYKLAIQVIIVHNHPSQNIEPSKEDIDFTDRLLKVGKLIDVEVIDHMIISETKYFSFSDKNLMTKLHNSGLFEIVKREQNELKQWKIDMIKEDAEKDERLKIAKILKAEGMDEKFIKKATGLHLGTIRSL